MRWTRQRLRRIRDGDAHPSTGSFSRYIDGDLPDADRMAIEQHVRECLPCRGMLGSLAQTVRLLSTLRVPDASGRAERIVAALAPQLERASRGWRPALRAALPYTVPIGLFVGGVLSLANKGGMLLKGHIDIAMCVVCAMDFLLPFVAMNVVLLWFATLVRRS